MVQRCRPSRSYDSLFISPGQSGRAWPFDQAGSTGLRAPSSRRRFRPGKTPRRLDPDVIALEVAPWRLGDARPDSPATVLITILPVKAQLKKGTRRASFQKRDDLGRSVPSTESCAEYLPACLHPHHRKTRSLPEIDSRARDDKNVWTSVHHRQTLLSRLFRMKRLRTGQEGASRGSKPKTSETPRYPETRNSGFLESAFVSAQLG